MKVIRIILPGTFFIFLVQICSGQNKADSSHVLMGISWGGTGKVCNVCHEPFNTKYSIKQTPYYNHQVSATTFRGNKMDGSPVLIRAINTDNNCLGCHRNNGSANNKPLKIMK